MNTFISSFLVWGFIIADILVFLFFLAVAVWHVWLMCKERLAMKRLWEGEEKQKTAPDDMPVLLSPKMRREYMLNHIEDGRLYAISSLCNSDTTIVCAKRYDAEEQRLYCYAYLWMSGKGDYNLHIECPVSTSKFCDFLGNKRLRIDLDHTPYIAVFEEEENISSYIVDRDYNTFVHSVQAAGFNWKIEQGEENLPGSYKYLLKETRTK